jgi:predicted Zn-dependent protease with MMP-like domain
MYSMQEITDEQFQALINAALEELPGEHVKNIKNVAILYEDWPTELQRQNTKLHPHQTLLGLYEGVPLAQRQGHGQLFPDRITLFKYPLMMQAQTPEDLKEQIKHTLWHEIAHYYGLNHDQIREKE